MQYGLHYHMYGLYIYIYRVATTVVPSRELDVAATLPGSRD